MSRFPDFARAANQGGDPDTYELENAAVDPDGTLDAALRELAPWAGRDVLDLGCGSGYWLPGYAATARSVLGVEPDPTLLDRARARDRRVRVEAGSAEHIPLPDASVDVVHARFAYFYPPGVDAGLAEVLRVLRPGGAFVMIDNDQRWGEFAELLAGSPWAEPQGVAEVTDRWWAERGAERRAVRSGWAFRSRADLDAVLHLEFPAGIADDWLRRHPGRTGLTYGYILFTVRR
jgi:ubiquinone/menaquinone biosynthesis C-methylase UbiE